MKKIAITQRLTENKTYFEVDELLDISWGKLLAKINYMPIILPYEYNFKEYFNEMNISGILLTGGNDLNELNKNKLSKKRDDFEMELIRYAIKESIPIFGVCRGMQIIAKYFGCSFNPISDQVNTRHKLITNQKSKYQKYLNNLETVNSFHNYTINDLSNELIISATNNEQVIKAIEHTKHKIFAQMWHSEREQPFIENELKIIGEFFK
jgi:putative glutamine amidotransferase